MPAAVGHLDGQRAGRCRRVGRIGIGQVLDQRLDRSRIGRAVEGDGKAAAGAATGNSADRHAAERHRARRQPDLAGAVALVADRHRVLGQQARDDKRAGGEIIVRIGEGDLRVEQLRRGVDGVFEKVNGRPQVGQRRGVRPQPSR